MCWSRGGGGLTWMALSRRWEQVQGLTWLYLSHLAAGLVPLLLTLPKPLAHISHAGVPRVSRSCLGAVLSGTAADLGTRLGSCPPVQELTLPRSIPWCWSSMSWWPTTRSRRAPRSAYAWASWWISLRRTNQVQRARLGGKLQVCSAPQSRDRNSNPVLLVSLIGREAKQPQGTSKGCPWMVSLSRM